MKVRLFSFSLIEVIVTLSIIAFLFSSFIPLVGKFRDNANRVYCMNNLRQIIRDVIAYQISNSHVMPASFGDTNDGKVNHWINYLIQQGTSYSVFQCPSLPEDMMFDPAGHDPATGNIYKKASYIMNIIGLNNWGNATLSSPKNTSCGWGTSSTDPVKLSQIAYPSKTIYITDVIAGISNNHSGVNDYRRTDLGITPTEEVVGYVRWVGLHHEGGFNAAFGDGHIEMMQSSTVDQWVAVPNFR